MRRSAILAVLLALAIGFALPAAAGADAAAASKDPPPAAAGQHRPMNTTAPMPTGMTKPGMTEGDVKKAADKRAQQMRPVIRREEASLPGAQGKP